MSKLLMKNNEKIRCLMKKMWTVIKIILKCSILTAVVTLMFFAIAIIHDVLSGITLNLNPQMIIKTVWSMYSIWFPIILIILIFEPSSQENENEPSKPPTYIMDELIKNNIIKDFDEVMKNIAIHEAGHAIMAMKLGLKLRSVEIFSSVENLGGTTSYYGPDDSFVDENYKKNQVIISYAGPATEKIVFGKMLIANAKGKNSDFVVAQREMEQILITSDEYRGYVSQGQAFDEAMNKMSLELFSKAEEIARENIDDIKKLSDRLIKTHYLNGDQIIEALKED